ncbi:hypothetical protein MJO28_012183 [Puccinia striiformis f. sp. tritici]|uniref:Rhodanese domain-containing protein n=2 Tax=Puccinia striiformis f. sp. tritici TaxID=168172 RepID=A0A0L0V5R8_9BASI|nr:hypothetical protein Pst134EB_023794 [Puccinia striiformis f. sp. tritici]KAI7942156.1 hypothetical protein MJO28_012183 [Puccinia striiformis f. sp. tritici]KAI7945866.1 hypothetical protein MJO29_012254 [Puccinia striiformis f. sp. tritici]KNE94608.1 hypothetical protein PSTG_12071 [Puccinia striiformis f. sp. tritici PST-78]
MISTKFYRARPSTNQLRLPKNISPAIQLFCTNRARTTSSSTISTSSPLITTPQFYSTRSSSQAISSSKPWKMHTDIEYRDLKPITEMPSDDILLIDVREESEVIQGNIPSSVNIPISKFEKLIELHPDEFIKILGFPKPDKDQKIIFYCRSGARSAMALEISKLKGFKNLRNYKGSWLDWIDKETPSS